MCSGSVGDVVDGWRAFPSVQLYHSGFCDTLASPFILWPDHFIAEIP